MHEHDMPCGTRVFVLSIADSEILFLADRNEIVSRVIPQPSEKAVPAPTAGPNGAAER